MNHFKGQLFWHDGHDWGSKYCWEYDDFIKFGIRRKRKHRR